MPLILEHEAGNVWIASVLSIVEPYLVNLLFYVFIVLNE